MARVPEQFGVKPHLSYNERLPKTYKEVEKVLKDVKACKGNLKTVINNTRLRGFAFKKVYALATNVLKHRHILDRIIQETELLKKETFLREELAGILIYELVYGRGLPGESRPVTVVKKYEALIRKAHENAMADGSLNVIGFQSLPRYARVNTLLTSVSDVLKNLRKAGYREIYYGENTSEKEYLDLVRNLETGSFLIDYHFKDLLVFASTENLTLWSCFKKNHVHIQDKSSYIPVFALDPKPGSVVIDACAAPGMKTIHIAAAMENNGKIYAYEKNENRFQTLKDMLNQATVQICEAECEDFYLVNTSDPKFSDLEYILVDPSCSGSGMVSRMDSVTDTVDSKNTLRLQKLAGFQILLLKHALTYPSVKRVVYSTCSISEQENEYVVHEVLNKFQNHFKLVSVMPEWPVRGSDNFEFGKLCLRAYPEETLTNGFFVAMFERLDYDEMLNAATSFPEKSSRKKKKRKKNLDENDDRNFVEQNEYCGGDSNVSEVQDNPELLNGDSSAGSHLSKRKKKNESYLSETFTEDKDDHIPFQHDDRKKEKRPPETDENRSKKKKNKYGVKEISNFDDVGLDTHNLSNISSADCRNFSKKKNKFAIENNTGDKDDVILLENDNGKKKKHSNEADNCCKKKKNKHKVEVSNSDVVDLETDDYNKGTATTKKHKHKEKYSTDVEVRHNLDLIADNNLPEYETTTEPHTHKKKHKRKHSKKDLEMNDSSTEMLQVAETVHKNKEASFSTTLIQHKKKHDTFEISECETTSESHTHKKKHKRKHSKKDLEMNDSSTEMLQVAGTVHKNKEASFSTSLTQDKKKHDTFEIRENIDAYDEDVNKTLQGNEEISIKKKHKKCKYKRVKEE